MNARNCREIGVDGGLCYREAKVRRGWEPPHAPAFFGFSFSATAPHHLSEATSHLTRGSSRRGPVRWQVPFGQRATEGRHVKGRAGLAAVLGGPTNCSAPGGENRFCVTPYQGGDHESQHNFGSS